MLCWPQNTLILIPMWSYSCPSAKEVVPVPRTRNAVSCVLCFSEFVVQHPVVLLSHKGILKLHLILYFRCLVAYHSSWPQYCKLARRELQSTNKIHCTFYKIILLALYVMCMQSTRRACVLIHKTQSSLTQVKKRGKTGFHLEHWKWAQWLGVSEPSTEPYSSHKHPAILQQYFSDVFLYMLCTLFTLAMLANLATLSTKAMLATLLMWHDLWLQRTCRTVNITTPMLKVLVSLAREAENQVEVAWAHPKSLELE